MDIFINDKKIDYEIENEKTIGEILGSLESECEKAGMTVTGILSEGVVIPADQLDVLFAQKPDSVKKLELTTISGSDIVFQLRDLGTQFTDCVPLLREIPVQLQTGKDLTVMQTINSFSTKLQTLYQLLPLVKITNITNESSEIDGIPLVSYPGYLAPLLADLLEALGKKDTVLVGDLTEYELAPKIEKLSAVLSNI